MSLSTGVVRKADLIKEGAQVLDRAVERGVASDMDAAAAVASAYARLAEALGDSGFSNRKTGNW